MSTTLGQWSIGPNDKRKRKRERRLHREPIVRRVADILAAGRSSKFEFEAACRHGLRSQLCLQGQSWREADKIAAQIVELALHRIGAARPRWAEGQPEASEPTVARYWCAHCGRTIPEDRRLYCSHLCAAAHASARHHALHRDENNAARRAAAAVWSAAQPERPCPVCGTLFRPRDPRQTVCSKRCAAVRASASRKGYAEGIAARYEM